jgi:hypothetical protein
MTDILKIWSFGFVSSWSETDASPDIRISNFSATQSFFKIKKIPDR